MNLINRIETHTNTTEAEIASWTDQERRAVLGYMRVWRRGSFAYSVIFCLIALLNLNMAASHWLLLAAGLLAILYVITTWVSRMFAEGRLIGPLKWLVHYPLDLLRVHQ